MVPGSCLTPNDESPVSLRSAWYSLVFRLYLLLSRQLVRSRRTVILPNTLFYLLIFICLCSVENQAQAIRRNRVRERAKAAAESACVFVLLLPP